MIKIRDWMSKPVITVEEGATVEVAVKLMDENNIGSLVVSAGDKPVGIITERDLIRRVLVKEKDIKKVKVSEVMTRNPQILDINATMLEVSRMMNKYGFRRIIIIEEGQIAGILTSKDLIELVSV